MYSCTLLSGRLLVKSNLSRLSLWDRGRQSSLVGCKSCSHRCSRRLDASDASPIVAEITTTTTTAMMPSGRRSRRNDSRLLQNMLLQQLHCHIVDFRSPAVVIEHVVTVAPNWVKVKYNVVFTMWQRQSVTRSKANSTTSIGLQSGADLRHRCDQLAALFTTEYLKASWCDCSKHAAAAASQRHQLTAAGHYVWSVIRSLKRFEKTKIRF